MSRTPAIPALLVAISALASAQSWNISTFAGGTLPVNSAATSASLYGPQSAIAIDSAGDTFFIDGNTVLRVDATTGTLTVAAGNGTAGYSGDNGLAVNAQLRNPNGIAIDSSGNLYISSFADNVVRMVSGGTITTIAGTGAQGYAGDNGPATSAKLNSPFGIAVDSFDNLYIADYGNNAIRKITGNVITTVAGNGIAGFGGDNGAAIQAQLNSPRAVAVDSSGNLYVADSANNRIRKVIQGVIGTIAGTGTPGFGGDNGFATGAQLNYPCAIGIDANDAVYIADYYNNRIRKVASNLISTVAGNGNPGFAGDAGTATKAQLNGPLAVALSSSGNLFIADNGNNRIREVSAGIISTIAGNGTSGFSGDTAPPLSAQMHLPWGIALDSSGGAYIADYQNNRIRKVTGGSINTIAGTGVSGFSGDGGTAAGAELMLPTAVAVDSSGNLYIADFGNNRIRKVSAGAITTVAGNGTPGYSGDNALATSAQFSQPASVAVDSAGNLYIADAGNNRIRKVSGGNIATVAGNGTPGFGGDSGPAVSAQLYNPTGVAVDSSGNIYIADTYNNRIRKVSSGTITTVAGNGSAGFSGDGSAAIGAQLSSPSSIAVNSAGSLFIADTGNNVIRLVSGGNISTIAGGGNTLGDNGPATSANLAGPQAVAVDSGNNVYIADTLNNRVRLLTPLPLAIAGPASLPGGTTGVAYTAVNFIAIGGTGTYTWSATNLPKGLAISTFGALTGTPTTAGTSTPQFTVKDSSGASANSSLPITIGLPVPVITTLSPASATVYGAAFTLTVNGTGFLTGATIQWNGAPLSTNVVSATQLTASVAATLLSSPGIANIAVTSGGATSATVSYPVNAPTPTATALNPASGIATGAAFTLTVTGTGFVTTSVVDWNNSPLSTTLVSASSLTATVPASLIAAAGTASVTVTSGGTPSAGLSFTINAPPAITSVNPVAATAGGAAFTLTVTGTGFVTGAQASVLSWNGTALATKVTSTTQVTASISAALIANPGSASLVVTSGGAPSGAFTFPINAQIPTLTAISPLSAIASGPSFTLTSTGTNFNQSSQIQWNGQGLATTFFSTTQLTASVDMSLIANSGMASVSVVNEQASSATLSFTINPPASISSTSPASVTAFGSAFTLTITGTGFLAGSTVQWNNLPLSTKVVSSTQVTASVPASDIGGAGNATVIVVSGGVPSGPFSFPINAPPPVISGVSPAAAIATGAAFTLTVNGTGFSQADTVQWAGAPLQTNFVSATQLTAFVTTSLIATAGNASVLVTAGSVSSGALTYPINPAPTIASLSPTAVGAGGSSFTLTVTGTGFVSGAQVQWNGAGIPTTFLSATQLIASVAAAAIASTAAITIQVTELGASSNGVTLNINGPPTITGLSPAAAAAGGAAFTLTVNGTGYVQGSTVNWNGTALTTKYVNATQLTASVTASLLATAGSGSITVTSAGTSSGPTALPINAPPSITALSPASVAGSGAAFTLTVNGTGFLSTSTVEWNGTALTTTFVSATQLTAAVPANTDAGAGTASIVAANPGGASSAAMKITLTAALPVVAAGAVVPVYSSANVIQPGSWISIYGTGLASSSAVWTGNFPTTLGGTSVKIDNKAAYLWFVSPTQINLQAPDDTATGQVNVVVTTAAGSVTTAVTLAPYGPSLSLLPGSSYVAGVILTPGGTGAYGGGSYDLVGPTGSFSFNTRPAKAGETLELFGVGFGATSPAVPAGKAFSGTAPTTNPVTVTIGGVSAKVLFAGVIESGVYQINVIVPSAGKGDQPLVATVGGTHTPAGVSITLQ